jgi:hypothetical protein
MNPRATLIGLLSGALAVATAACGPAFTATGSTGTGGADGGPSTGTAPDGSTGTAGGNPGCSPDSCADGQYCNSQSGVCTSCDDFSRLEFDTPAALGVSLGGQSISALFPRMAGDSSDLWLVEIDGTSHAQIAKAPANAAKNGWGAAAVFGPLSGSFNDSGPLYLHDSSVLEGLGAATLVSAKVPVLVFHSNRVPKTQLFAFPLDGSPTAVAVPLTLPGGGTIVSHFAVADLLDPPRFFWITDASMSPLRLVTGTSQSGPDEVKLKTSACDINLAREPWVTPTGAHLFFAAVHTGGSCTPISDQTSLYVVALDSDGKAKSDARPVFPGDTTSFDSTPALTPDHCRLIFSRHDGTGKGAVWGARRK